MGVRRSRGIPGNLPADVTSFVGRRRELSQARRLLGAARLLTLTGVGGVGKTRLALHIAQNARHAYPDGLYFVDLARLRDPELLAATVATALGLDDRSSRPPLDRLTDFLAGRRLLLLLDNCEHLREPCASLVAALLRGSAGIRLLTTSRQPLGIGGECVLAVPPLSLPDTEAPAGGAGASDAERLLEERAVQMVPGFSPGPDERRAMAGLCRRLDGIPLAIELAAVRLRALSVHQVLERLDDRFALLTMGERTADPRQRTLRAAIDWSHDLCSAEERALWASLSVFPAGFDLEAAEDVCRAAGIARQSVVHVLGGLVDKSIVQRDADDPSVRFRLLDTIREYGRSLLAASGHAPAVRRAHRDHYRRMAEVAGQAWFGPKRPEWLARLGRELPNVRTALEYCLAERDQYTAAFEIIDATWDYWISHGMLSEGRRWLDLALRCEPATSPARVRALWVAGRLAMLQGDVEAARSLMDECVAQAGRIGDHFRARARARAAEIAGMTAHFAGDYEQAVVLLQQATDGYRAAGEPPVVAMLALYELAWATCALGRLDRAQRLGERLMEINEKYGADSYRFLSLWVMGLIRYRQGDPRGAAELIRQSIRLQASIGDVYCTVKALEVLAWAAAADGRHREAARLLGSAGTLWTRAGIRLSTLAPFRDFHDACVDRLRAALGDDAFAAAFDGGAALALDQAVARAVAGDRGPGDPSGAGAAPDESGPLTRREREVAALVTQGLTNKQIAAALVISQRTAEGHVEHILGKLGLTSRTQIASWATTHLPRPDAPPALR